MTPTIEAQALRYQPEIWQLIPKDRKSARWLKQHRPQATTSFQNGHPYPVTLVSGSQLIELIARARVAGITVTHPGD